MKLCLANLVILSIASATVLRLMQTPETYQVNLDTVTSNTRVTLTEDDLLKIFFRTNPSTPFGY